MTSCSTHVLDAVLGQPASGLDANLSGPSGAVVAESTTDDDGRISWQVDLTPGVHTIEFATGAWFAAADRSTFYPTIAVTFEVTGDRPHLHVALLLSPYAYTTYRGS